MNPWEFVNRFCFIPTPDRVETVHNNDKNNFGYFQFKVEFPTGATPSLLMYYDGFQDWIDVYEGDESCSERKAKATVAIDLSTTSAFVSSVTPDDLNRVQKARGQAYLRSKTNTWFFVASRPAPSLSLSRSLARSRSRRGNVGPWRRA